MIVVDGTGGIGGISGDGVAAGGVPTHGVAVRERLPGYK